MRLYVSMLAFALASCEAKPKTTAVDQFCQDFITWSQSGPRMEMVSSNPTRIVNFTLSNGCYFPRGDGKSGFSKCVVVDWGCQKENLCEDDADQEFRQAIAMKRLLNNSVMKWFVDISGCLGGNETPEAWGTNITLSDNKYSVLKNGSNYILNYDEDQNAVQIQVMYGSSN